MKKAIYLNLLIISFLLGFQQKSVGAITYLDVTNTATSGAGSFFAIVTSAAAKAGTAANPVVIRFSSLPVAASYTILQNGFKGLELTGHPYLTIDGTTAPGYSCVTGPTIKIICDGSAGSGGGGFCFSGTSSNAILKGVIIIGNIRMTTVSNCQVTGCFVNVDFGGVAATPCNLLYACVRIDGTSNNNIIGGLNDCDRNILCAGTGTSNNRAVYLVGGGTGNQILGNYCGTNKAGLGAIGDWFDDRIIFVDGPASTIINGNVLSNGAFGIWLDGAASNCSVLNNMIGADKNGIFQIPSFTITQNGIMLRGANDGALISGNVTGNFTGDAGGFATGVNICLYAGNDNVTISNNWVGVDKNYNKAGSAWCGIFTRGNNTTITGNIVGDNGIDHVAQTSHGIGTDGSVGCTITNNWVGVTPTGLDIGNGDTGIELNGGGGSHTVSGNIIGFNKSLRGVGSGGIGIWNSTASNIIDNNYIGVTPSGQNAGNLGCGVTSDNPNQTISNNRIAFNLQDGINLYAGADNIYITNNCMWCNGSGAFAGTARGIKFNASNGSYGENYTIAGSVPAGPFTEIKINPIGAGATQTDTSGANWIIRGYSPAGATIEIFILDDCHLCTANGAVGAYLNEGQTKVGTVSAASNPTGFWSISLPKVDIGRGLVATATGVGSGSGVNKRTSEFSNPICFNKPCVAPKTATITPNPNPPTNLCEGTALSFTGGYTVPLMSACAIQYYYGSWYKGASLLAGPTLIVPPTSPSYSIPSLVIADAGTYTFRIEAGNATGVTGCPVNASVAVTVVNCPPAPVTWLTFYGLNAGEKNKLFWNTANETGNDHFEIERSTDGKSFEMIGSVNSIGVGGASYSYEDLQIEKGKTYYYRIKQVDADKNYSYTEIIAINTNGGLSVNLFPNPAGNSATLNITSEEDTQYKYILQDVLGQVTSEHVIDITKGVSQAQLDFSNIANGMYILTIQSKTHTTSIIRLSIQK
jgi:parallel beta-helix repeat protein